MRLFTESCRHIRAIYLCGLLVENLAFAPVLKRDPTLHVYVTTVMPEDCDLQWTVFNHSFKEPPLLFPPPNASRVNFLGLRPFRDPGTFFFFFFA